MTSLVGLDVGTTGVKALALSPDGEVVGRAEEGYPLSVPRPGWAEQDPDDWVRAAERVLEQLGARGERVGLSGQMHGLVALDSKRRVIRPAILWNDQRTAAECAEIEERIGLERLIELTGNRALPGFTAPKLLWLRRHEPEAYERIAHVLLPKDYVRLRLFDELATDAADASGTLLFDVAGRRWSDEVLEALELAPEWLPRVGESTEVAGAGDQAAGAVGVGVVAPGPASIVLGTSGVVFAPLEGFVHDPEGRAHVFCHAAPGTWHAMGVMLTAAGSMSWFRHTLAPDAAYGALDPEAEAWEPGVEGLLFAPYLAGERTPHADPDARAAFVGLSLRHDRGALVRAVLEGVSYGLRDSLELLRGLGCTIDAGRVSGGGARSPLWVKILASVLGIPLQRTAVEEGAAFGAALLAGVASGAFRDVQEAVDACVHVREEVEPDPEWETHLRRRLRALPVSLSGPTTLGGSMSVRFGILSTARINRLVLAGARESDRVEVTAVASRDLARAETYAQEWGIGRAYGSYEDLLADPELDAIYNPLPNSMHVEWSISGARSREARPLREAAQPAARGRRARFRRGRTVRADPDRGVHVEAQPAGGPAEGARRSAARSASRA